MAYEEYVALSEKVVSLPYTQRLDLLTLLAESLNEKYSAPKNLAVSSKEDLHNKLMEGLEDFSSGKVIAASDVKNIFKAKYGI